MDMFVIKKGPKEGYVQAPGAKDYKEPQKNKGGRPQRKEPESAAPEMPQKRQSRKIIYWAHANQKYAR